MEAKYAIELLDRQAHDREAFACGVAVLDAYLKKQASQDSKRNIARVYVLIQLGSRDVVGYYTLSAASIEPAMLPAHITRRLPRYDTFPALLIGRLAVDLRHRGHRLGEYLLLDALHRCLTLSQDVGAMAVRVDAKDEAIAQFYERYGFQRFEDRPLSLYMPIEKAQPLTFNL